MCRQAGFTLEEIKLVLATGGGPSWKAFAERKRDQLREQAEHLGTIADQLDHALRCPSPNVFDCEHFRLPWQTPCRCTTTAAACRRGGVSVVAEPRSPAPATNGSGRPDRSQSRFFCNLPRKIALLCFVVAFAALVIGGGFAEISTNGSPTSLETAVVRWTIVGSLVIGFVAYVIGGRLLAERSGGGT